VTLTAAGEALLPLADQVLDLADEAKASVAAAVASDGRLTGTVTMSAPETLLTYRVPSVLSRFRALHPGVTVVLRPTPVGRFRGETRRAVANGSVDVAFVLDTPLNLAGFHAEPLVAEPVSVIAAPAHVLARAPRATPGDLDGLPILLPEAPDSGCAYRAQFERHLADDQVTVGSMLEFASIEAVKQCVLAGMGVSVLPRVAVEAEISAGRLSQLRWSEPFELFTQIVWNARRSVDPSLAAFMETARSVLVPPPTLGDETGAIA
jgi:DNA-binding transcriptional LysR family regulator